MFYKATQSQRNFRNKVSVYKNPLFNFIKVLSPSDVSINSLYWFKVYKASDFPLFTVTTDYFAIGSTDHSNNPTVIWGECDDMYMRGFVEKGTIPIDYAETPFLIKITTSESGLASDEYFLYYHTGTDDPDNAGIQATHLVTTSGGNQPHLCTWTQQGKVLGNSGSETHTGYLNVIKRGTSDYIGFHTTMTSVGTWKMSTSPDGLNWTRGGLIDITLNLPANYNCSHGSIYPFIYNGTSYVMSSFWITNTDIRGVMICEHDANYRPIGTPHIMFYFYEQGTDYTMGFEGDYIYIYYKWGDGNTDVLGSYYARAYDLKQLL